MSRSYDSSNAFVTLIVALVVIPLGILFRGFVISKVWLWHVASIFPQLPALSLSQGISVSLAATALTYFYVDDSKESDDPQTKSIQKIFLGVLLNAIILLHAWIIYLFQS